jgi:hypothetical protein
MHRLPVSHSPPALAEAIVDHGRVVCETADHLWRVLGRVSIPTGGLTDQRQQHKATFDTEVMARVALYQTIYDPSQSEVAVHLEPRPALLKELGLSRASTQQNLSYVLRHFSDKTTVVLHAAATGIAHEAVHHGVIMEARVPIFPDDDDLMGDDESTASREYVREQGSKLIDSLGSTHSVSLTPIEPTTRSTRTNRCLICS